MSVTQVPLRPLKRGSLLKLWLGIAALVLAAFLLARAGAGSIYDVEVETIAEGKGDPLTEMDGVLIEYKGTTDDGTVFDSTEGRGPAPMLVGQVVPGFKLALMKMREGGSYKVLIPGRLAYGPNPPEGSGLKPNADLHFDVKVLQVVRDAAIGAAQAQAQARAGAGPPEGGAAPPEGAPVR